MPTTREPTSFVRSSGTIRTTTGFEETPAATVWNGPGRPSSTWKRYVPSRFRAMAATTVLPRMRLTRVPGALGESRPAKSTTCPNVVAPGAFRVNVVSAAGPAAAGAAATTNTASTRAAAHGASINTRHAVTATTSATVLNRQWMTMHG